MVPIGRETKDSAVVFPATNGAPQPSVWRVSSRRAPQSSRRRPNTLRQLLLRCVCNSFGKCYRNWHTFSLAIDGIDQMPFDSKQVSSRQRPLAAAFVRQFVAGQSRRPQRQVFGHSWNNKFQRHWSAGRADGWGRGGEGGGVSAWPFTSLEFGI